MLKDTAVHICLGHIGKISRPLDMGATVRDDDGRVIYEAVESIMFTGLLVEALRSRDYDGAIFIYGDGDYGERAFKANSNDTRLGVKHSVYISPHYNAGGGAYSLVLYDGRSEKSRNLAETIARRWRQEANLEPVKLDPLVDGKRGWNIVRYTSMPAVILEPLFLDNPQHLQMLFSTVPTIAVATATAIIEYFENLQ